MFMYLSVEAFTTLETTGPEAPTGLVDSSACWSYYKGLVFIKRSKIRETYGHHEIRIRGYL